MQMEAVAVIQIHLEQTAQLSGKFYTSYNNAQAFPAMVAILGSYHLIQNATLCASTPTCVHICEHTYCDCKGNSLLEHRKVTY